MSDTTPPRPVTVDLRSAPARTNDRAPCPPWCRTEHDEPDQQQHLRAIGGFWQREHRTTRGRVVRPAGSLVEVMLSRAQHDDGHLDEDQIAVEQLGADKPLSLTIGEARRLIAMLTFAADQADGLNP